MSSGTTLFDVFDGIRPMARELGERASTVQDWKNHGRVPATKQPHVLRVARRLRLPVTAMLIIFPNGVPADFEEQPDLFSHDASAPCLSHKGVVTSGAPIVACDRSAVLHPERAQ
jgi:hypothetical protein